MKYILIAIIPLIIVGCATVSSEEHQQQINEMNMYMLSHGHGQFIPDHQ